LKLGLLGITLLYLAN